MSAAAMIVYEVNLEIDAGIAAEYRDWLDAHVAEILALPGFTGARILEVLEPAPPSRRIALCVRYTLADATALDVYLREHAPRLRAEGVARFGDGFRAQRRILRETGNA
jgi:hypothetical protein